MRHWADINLDSGAQSLIRIDVAPGVEPHSPEFASADGWAWTPDGWVSHPGAAERVTAWLSDFQEIEPEHVEPAQIDVLVDWVTAQGKFATLIGRPAPPSVAVFRVFLIALRTLDERVVDRIQPSSILRPEVVDALNAVAAWDLAAEWCWMNAPAAQRDSSPRLLAHVAAAQQCLALDEAKA